jgi:hypothetical protein
LVIALRCSAARDGEKTQKTRFHLPFLLFQIYRVIALFPARFSFVSIRLILSTQKFEAEASSPPFSFASMAFRAHLLVPCSHP